MFPTYIAIDTETGGIGPEVSLLTAWLGVYDKDFILLDSLDLKIKPKNKIYCVTAGGLTVNKINIIEHDKIAFDEKQSASLLYEFIHRWSSNGNIKLIPIGHNVKFDIIKICEVLISTATWNKFVSYRTLDTGVIAQFLKVLHCMPEVVSGSLESIISHYNLSIDGVLHTAETDAKMTVEVLKSMIKNIKT